MQLGQRFRSPWWVVLGATLGMMVGNTPVTLFTFGLFLIPVTSEFGWSRGTFAAVVSASQLLGAAAMPFLGKLTDRHGLRRVTLVSVVVFSFATGWLSQAESFVSFVLLYAIAGVAGAGRGPISFPKAISGRFDARRGLALGIAYSGLGIGSALMPAVTALLMETVGWRGAYLGLGVLTFAIAFPSVLFFLPEMRGSSGCDASVRADSRPGSALESVKALRTNRSFWLLMTVSFLASLALIGTVTHVVPLLTDKGISIEFAAWVLSLAGLASIGGRLIGGYLLDRFSPALVAGLFFLFALAGIILLNQGFGIPSVLGGVALGLGVGAEMDILAFLASRHFDLRRFGETFGYIVAVSVLGIALGPWLMAACFDAFDSYRVPLIAFGSALVLTALLVYCLEHTRLSAAGIPLNSRT